jgi:tRNA-specific 2-thiouridylase
LFPLGDLRKPAVRMLAAEAGLPVHDKKDSTGICFIGERPFKEFLSRYIPVRKGPIRTLDGNTLGEHDGVHFYTLGQRRGLGIGGIQGMGEAPWYVVDKDRGNNILYVAQGQEHPMLYSGGLTARKLHWITGEPAQLPYRCEAKTRYRQPDQHCTITALDNGAAVVQFDQPQKAVTPGQYIVFYQGETCLGSGMIDAPHR